MKKRLINFGGLVLFYSVIVFGVLLLNLRFTYLNNLNNTVVDETYIAMNK